MAMAVVGQRATSRHVMAFHNSSSSPNVTSNQHVGLLAIPVSGSIISPVAYASETPDRPIGYGAFGVVWAVTDPRDGKRVALKKMSNVFQNVISALRVYRELRMLCHFRHENVLSALDILQPAHVDFLQEIFVVTELMQSDLHKIIVSPQPLTSDHVKVFLYQILRGLKYLQTARVLHRDIKPGNLLVNSNCCLKICDFGLARIMEPDESVSMTQEVVTQYYRAPEILMGAVHYTSAVDIWSVGCIFAELLSRRILFQASAPIQQLDKITEILGTPSYEDMPTACQGARDYIRSRPHKPAALNQFYSLSEQATHEAVHLLCRMLVLNPNKRITAADALTHPYLDEGRLRFHSCMCTCCTPGTQGRNFCADLEPECTIPFDFLFEKSLTSVSRLKEKLYTFIVEHQQRSSSRLPLCLNPHAAAIAKIQSVVKGDKSWQTHSQHSMGHASRSQRPTLPPYAAV